MKPDGKTIDSIYRVDLIDHLDSKVTASERKIYQTGIGTTRKQLLYQPIISDLLNQSI